ncbi:MAG: undecaprenyldiphospho-muramoylpentapeptide beta-N-acetylglucosaminyltransferase [Myxococcota bacterium]
MSLRVLIAGGGTGGHLFPALAVAAELRAGADGAEILFVGTRRGLEASLIPRHGYAIAFIETTALKGMGGAARARSLATLPRALWQSRKILAGFRPDVVLGVGGYASGPVVLAARLAGLPTLLAEQNAIPGLTNRVLGRFARVVCVAFQESASFFPAGKVRVTGNPVRREIAAKAGAAAPASRATPCVFVFGGSQGAHAVNALASAALVRLSRAGTRLAVLHQTGEADLEAMRARYAEAGVLADVRVFVDDMGAAYAQADLVVARAGATTLAELCAAGRPAILIPFPHAADDHQWQNARTLRDAGAALVFRQEALDDAVLADVIRSLLADPERRARMAEAMRRLDRPDAAAAIAEECRRLGGKD